MSELTEAERETLMLAQTHGSRACRAGECMTCQRLFGAVTAILTERERAAGERAWDECHRQVCSCGKDGPGWTRTHRNPYLRADRGTSAGGGE